MNSIDAQYLYLKSENVGVNRLQLTSLEEPKYYLQDINKIYNFDDTILFIEDLGYIDDYVYDLETEAGNFAAGVGSIIVKNTDSVFLKYDGKLLSEGVSKEEIIEECFKLGEIMGEETTKLFKQPILLEFEKIYYPLMMLKKKTYMGKMYEAPNTIKYKLDNKGVVLKRRDNPNITKIVYQGIVDILFSQGISGINNAKAFLHDQITRILENNVPYEDLIVTKTYKTGYKSENIPHKVLAEKMEVRDSGSAPKCGDRVPYIYLETKNKHAKQYEKVEHPDYAKEHNLKLDSIYYMNQIKNPIVQLLSTVISESEAESIFLYHKKEHDIKSNGLQKISDFFKVKPKCIL